MSNPLFTKFRSNFRPFDLPEEAKSEEFELELPFSDGWDTAKNKLLIVIGHVSKEDLKTGSLFGRRSISNQVLTNTLTYARQTAKKYDKKFDSSSFAYAAINFQAFKTYDKSAEYIEKANMLFRKRVFKYVKKYEPTHILIMSDIAARILIGDQITDLNQRNYNVFELDVAGVQCKVSTTIDFCRTFDTKVNSDTDSDEAETSVGIASLLGFISRCATSLYLGRNPYAKFLQFNANPVMVDTLPKFKEFFKELWQQKVVAYDAEWIYGPEVGVTDAKFLSVQFSWNIETGYVIPLYHPESAFNAEELKYIEQRIRKFFMRKVSYADGYELLMQNAQTDLTMIRELFGVPFMYWPIWDTIGGESGIDENIRFLNNFRKSKINSLDTLAAQYGNSFYLDGTTFGKAERGSYKDCKLEGDVIRYSSFDAQVLLGIQAAQQYRARHTNFGKDGTESYLPAYRRFMLNQFSNNMYAVSHMEHRGIWVDIELMQSTMIEGSDFRQELDGYTEEFYQYPSVIKANKILLREGSKAATSLFGKISRVFKISSPDNLKLLFFGVLGLDPVSYTDKGDVSTNEEFQEAYKETIPEVATFQEVSKLNTIMSTYLKGWYKRIMSNPDSRKDGRIRPRYGFFEVITGRSNSSKPSLQNVPARHKSAKYIKRLFAARLGHMILKMDFSAHEVRQTAVAAADKDLANAFWIGRNLRREYIENPTPELFKRIKLEGDIHRVNYGFIFKMMLEAITQAMRDSCKAIVFGLIYGKSVRTLSFDLSGGVISAAKKAFKEAKADYYKMKEEDPDNEDLFKLKIKVISAKKEWDALESKSREVWIAETQIVFDELLNKFPRMKKWLDWAVSMGRNHLYVYSPFGRRRNLFAYLTGLDNMCAAMDRRAMNSPIQGMGADIGHTTNYLFHMHLYETLMKFGYMDEESRVLPCGIETMVHDSIREEVPYELLLINVYILQWVATVGVANYYGEVFQAHMNICPEIDMELGSSDAILHKWDWSYSDGQSSIKNIVKQALKDQHLSGHCPDVKAAYKQIFGIPKEVLEYLQTRFPVVGDFVPAEDSNRSYIKREDFMKA